MTTTLEDNPTVWVTIPLAHLWLIGLTNAHNLMDGIDGIAEGQALSSGLG